MPLLQPAPVLMRAVELHVASKQLAALCRSDRLALLHDLLADSQPVPNCLPSLLQLSHSTISGDHLVALCAHARLSDEVSRAGTEADGDEEYSNGLTSCGSELAVHFVRVAATLPISQRH